MDIPDSKVHEAKMGPTWGRQDPGWPHVGPMNFAIWDVCIIRSILLATLDTVQFHYSRVNAKLNPELSSECTRLEVSLRVQKGDLYFIFYSLSCSVQYDVLLSHHAVTGLNNEKTAKTTTKTNAIWWYQFYFPCWKSDLYSSVVIVVYVISWCIKHVIVAPKCTW